MVCLTLPQFGAVVGGAVVLSVTDGSALADLAELWLRQKLGIEQQPDE